MRKTFALSENTFKKDGLLKEMTNYVVESLGGVYPELERNVKTVHQIVDYEEEVYKSIREGALINWQKIVTANPKLSELDALEMPGLVAAYKELKDANITSTLPVEFGFKLYDTHGLDKEMIANLCRCLDLRFDKKTFEIEIERLKQRSKATASVKFPRNLPKTDDSSKYDNPSSTPVRILRILLNDKCVETIEANTECCLVLNKTCLYHEAGGQTGDAGLIEFNPETTFRIYDVVNLGNTILHKGVLISTTVNATLKINAEGTLRRNKETRLGNTLNHTATHLLNAAIKKRKGATCQKSSKVTQTHLTLDLAVFHEKLTLDDVVSIENDINAIINKSLPVQIKIINSQELLALDGVTVIPGEIYPEDGIRLIEIREQDFVSM